MKRIVIFTIAGFALMVLLSLNAAYNINQYKTDRTWFREFLEEEARSVYPEHAEEILSIANKTSLSKMFSSFESFRSFNSITDTNGSIKDRFDVMPYYRSIKDTGRFMSGPLAHYVIVCALYDTKQAVDPSMETYDNIISNLQVAAMTDMLNTNAYIQASESIRMCTSAIIVDILFAVIILSFVLSYPIYDLPKKYDYLKGIQGAKYADTVVKYYIALGTTCVVTVITMFLIVITAYLSNRIATGCNETMREFMDQKAMRRYCEYEREISQITSRPFPIDPIRLWEEMEPTFKSSYVPTSFDGSEESVIDYFMYGTTVNTDSPITPRVYKYIVNNIYEETLDVLEDYEGETCDSSVLDYAKNTLISYESNYTRVYRVSLVILVIAGIFVLMFGACVVWFLNVKKSMLDMRCDI